jgi:hypothetical protein
MPAGRPTDYNEDIAAKFCAEIALGNSLRSVVARDDMPSHTAIYEWLSKHKEFAEQYARAKEDSGDSDADRIEEIAEKVLSGEIDPQQGRVAMDAYKWTAGKKRPKKYGDRVQQDVNINDYSSMSSDERKNKIAELQRQLDEQG